MPRKPAAPWGYTNAASSTEATSARGMAREILGSHTFSVLSDVARALRRDLLDQRRRHAAGRWREVASRIRTARSEILNVAGVPVRDVVRSLFPEMSISAGPVTIDVLGTPTGAGAAVLAQAKAFETAISSALASLDVARQHADTIRQQISRDVRASQRLAGSTASRVPPAWADLLPQLARAAHGAAGVTPTGLAYLSIAEYFEPPCSTRKEFEARVRAWKVRLSRAREPSRRK